MTSADFDTIRETYRTVLAGKFRWRTRDFSESLNEIACKLGARGIRTSGAMVKQVKDCAIAEVREREAIACKELRRVLSQSQARLSLPDLELLINDAFDALSMGIAAAAQQHLSFAPNREAARQSFAFELNTAITCAKAEARAEAQLFALAPPGDVPLSNTNIHVAGNVGSIQTGNGSVANVTMNLATEQVAKALQELEQVLDERGDAETIEVVHAAQDELRRPSRLAVLRSLLFTIATTVQVAGAAEPALQALRDGAKALGIPLP